MTAQWYVLRVVSGFESKARDYIIEASQEGGYSSDIEDIDVFSEDKVVVRFGRKVNVKSSAMPGYLMIKMRCSQPLVSVIRTCRHVLGFLGSSGDTPNPVSEGEMLRLKSVISKVDHSSVNFFVGEEIKIVDGPFATCSGVIEEVYDKKDRVKVAVAILGRKIPVVLEYAQIEKVSD